MCRPGTRTVLFGEKNFRISQPAAITRPVWPLRDHAIAVLAPLVGLRPPAGASTAISSHPDCRAALILIVVPHEDKIRIVLDGLRGEDSIAELCRKEGIAQSLYYTWSKEFMEAGKRRLAGDTARAATTGEVQDLRREARALKECVADLTLENRLLKKSMIADGEDGE